MSQAAESSHQEQRKEQEEEETTGHKRSKHICGESGDTRNQESERKHNGERLRQLRGKTLILYALFNQVMQYTEATVNYLCS